jgi:hypothetical protein
MRNPKQIVRSCRRTLPPLIKRMDVVVLRIFAANNHSTFLSAQLRVNHQQHTFALDCDHESSYFEIVAQRFV